MKLSLLPLLLLLSLTTCKKAETDPVPTGTNTASCSINGQPFVATGWKSTSLLGPGDTPPFLGGFYEDSLYYLQMRGTVNSQRIILSLFIRGRQAATYNFNQLTSDLNRGGLRHTLAYASYEDDSSEGEFFITSPQHTGILTLSKADTTTGISAGTFEFTAASTRDPSKTVTITDGRFDRQQ